MSPVANAPFPPPRQHRIWPTLGCKLLRRFFSTVIELTWHIRWIRRERCREFGSKCLDFRKGTWLLSSLWFPFIQTQLTEKCTQTWLIAWVKGFAYERGVLPINACQRRKLSNFRMCKLPLLLCVWKDSRDARNWETPDSFIVTGIPQRLVMLSVFKTDLE